MSTKTVKFYEEWGSLGAWNIMSNTYSLHCHHQNDCIKMGSCVSHSNVSLIVHKTVSINHNFWREEEGEPKRIEPKSFCLPAKRLTARPHWLTKGCAFGGIYVPCSYSHARWSYRRRFLSLISLYLVSLLFPLFRCSRKSKGTMLIIYINTYFNEALSYGNFVWTWVLTRIYNHY